MFWRMPACVYVCGCVFLRGTHINENTNWKEEGCQPRWICKCSTQCLHPSSESHSPWGSRGSYERWLTVKEALSLFMWIKAKFSVPLKSKPCCFSSSLTSFFLHRCISPIYLFNLNSRGFHLFLCAQMFQPALNSIVRHISYTEPMRRVRANHSAWHVMQLQWTNETVITKIMRNMQYRPVTLGLVICEHDSPCAVSSLIYYGFWCFSVLATLWNTHLKCFCVL